MASQFGTKLVGIDIFNQNFLFSRDRSTLTLFSRKLTRLRSFPLVHVVNGRIVFNKRKFDYKQVKYPSEKNFSEPTSSHFGIIYTKVTSSCNFRFVAVFHTPGKTHLLTLSHE